MSKENVEHIEQVLNDIEIGAKALFNYYNPNSLIPWEWIGDKRKQNYRNKVIIVLNAITTK